MVCTPIPGGFACSRGRREKPKTCKCGAPATKLCDWRHPRRKSGTCDEPLCDACAFNFAPEVDFCPTHERERRQRAADHVLTNPPRPVQGGLFEE